MKASKLKSYIKENILKTLSEATIETDADNIAKVKASADKDDVIKVVSEDEDIDDKDAVKSAMKSKGKFKKLDVATKALKDITTEMKSLARKYSAADNESEKEKIKDTLKSKTSKKKELESLVNKLEKDVV
jgi:hypothetical protein|tara:strand:- start:2666 stop:3058 length:393 start_codon:yes stop_codon:yes gene_type:complete